MSFEKNASPILRKIVADIAPGSASAECPCEVVSSRKDATVRLRVAREVFGAHFRDNKALGAFIDRGDYAETSAKKCRLSQEMLPFDGIGDDSFFLNEYFADEGPKLSGFTTLRSWDEYTHHQQEGFAAEEGRRPEGVRPYEGRLLWNWARWLDGGRLVYGNLSVAALYLSAQLEEHAGEIARSRYPTEWIEGPEHGTRTENGLYSWNMLETPTANGALRFAAEHLAHLVVKAWTDGDLTMQIRDSGVWVARARRDEDHEINEDVVFSGVEAMDRARFRHWLGDLSSIPDGSEIFAAIEAHAKARISDFMEHVFVALEGAAKAVGDLEKDNWRELCEIAAAGLAAHHPPLAGLQFRRPEEIVG